MSVFAPLAISQPPDCDLEVTNQISVPGINPSWISKHPYSTPQVPAMGFATSDMSAAIDPTVANYMNYYGIPEPGSPSTYQYGKSCDTILSALKAAPTNTPLVSLQRFQINGIYLYQAVWSPPIP
jgi:hypothetical protein